MYEMIYGMHPYINSYMARTYVSNHVQGQRVHAAQCLQQIDCSTWVVSASSYAAFRVCSCNYWAVVQVEHP